MNKVDIDDLLEDASGGSDFEEGPNEEINEASHAKLVDKVKSIYGSREVRQRAEPSRTVSEFDFSRDGGLTAFDMLKDLNNTAELKKKRNKILKIKKKAAALPVPLPKTSRERLQRVIGYAKTSDELSKWDAVVDYHQSADQIQFPLNDEKIRVESGAEFAKKFTPSTKLEEQVEALLSSSKHRLDVDAELTQFEEEQLKSMSKEEAVARLTELRRLRSLMHSEAVRNRRVRKIKSRKFHKMQRKDKMKQAIREFEQLKVTDPQKALEKLEELERIRREERVSLRHKTKHKWAAQIARKGKFDKEAQEALRERIELGRELETKVKLNEDADSDEEKQIDGEFNDDDENHSGSSEEERNELEKSLQEEEQNDNEENPWLRRTFFEEIKPSQTKKSVEQGTPKHVQKEQTSKRNVIEVPDNFKSKAQKRKHQEEKVPSKTDEEPESVQDESDEENPSEEDEDDVMISESTRVLDPYAPNNEDDIEEVEGRVRVAEKEYEDIKKKFQTQAPKSAVCIDPEKVLKVTDNKKLKSKFKETAFEDGEEDEEGETEFDADKQRKLIQEAFAGDDVVADFIKDQKDKDASERQAQKEAALQKKGLDGDWVTPSNINKLDDRKAKFLLQRKAFKPHGAVIHEDANLKGIKKLKVVDVPKGFTSVAQFETVLKQPVGMAFNTQRAFHELTKPRVVTKMGRIIKPIDESALVKMGIKSDLKTSRRRTVAKKK